MFSLSNVVIQSAINSFDDPVLAAGSSASASIEGFVYAAMNAFYQTAITFVGQNYGAGKCKRVDRIAVQCVSFSVISGLAFGNLAYFFGETLAGFYVPAGEHEVIAQALIRLSFIACPYFICGIMDTLVGVLRGIGYSVVPMVVSLVGACGLRLVWVAVIFPVYHTASCLYISYPISWLVTGAVHLIFFLCVRKRAYAKVEGSDLTALEGRHPPLSQEAERQ